MGIWTNFVAQGEVQKGQVVSSGKKLYVSTSEGLTDLEHVQFAPLTRPTKIIGVGANYPAAIGADAPEFRFFFKPPSSLATHKDAIMLPEGAKTVIVEPELAVIIGRQAKNVRAEDAKAYILGYTMANDIAVLEQASESLALAKCYDTFTPTGPWVVENFNFQNATIALKINGEEKVRGYLRDMFVSPTQIIERLSSVMTLEAGDLILTGTPGYFGPVRAGDAVSVVVSGIGSLDNTVA